MTSLQGDTNIELLCSMAGVSRAGYYRHFKEKSPNTEEVELRDLIHTIFIKNRCEYGYRRMSNELKRQGWCVNHKRIARLMRDDNLLAIQPKLFVHTTNSDHDFEVALNLASRMTVNAPDQLWVADITYIRLGAEFVFLAVILDVFTRKIVGWSLERHLKASLAIDALRKAILSREPASGLVHHSDRGVQYACGDYAEVLREHGITPSMSRPGNPYDNAWCESFMKTLKREEIRATQYLNLEHLRGNLEEFIDNYYNERRLHSALNYRPPDEVDREAKTSDALNPATIRYYQPSKQTMAACPSPA